MLCEGATALCNSATNGTAVDDAEMLVNGDLVLHVSSGAQVWDSGTSGEVSGQARWSAGG